jgi:hypothetical protein
MNAEGDEEVRVERLAMGISHDDFFRVLPSVLSAATWRRDGLSVHAQWPHGAQLIATVSAQQQRRIASLCLPYVDVGFGFRGMDIRERHAFLERFDRAFQKGGG